MKLVLAANGRYMGLDDILVDNESQARIFDSILEADAYSAWYELVYGLQLFVKKHSRTV